MNTQIIAHRGASYLANHENTMEAFQLALDVHANTIELDIRQTFDKILIVFHNEHINGFPVSALTYHQIQEMTNTSGYQVPTLEEVLLLARQKIHLLIEFKEAGYEKKAITLINSFLSYEEYSVQSFLDIVVRRIKKIDTSVNTGLLVGIQDADLSTRFNEYFPIRRLHACHADFISPHYYLATPEFILRMKHAGIPVLVWTVDSPKIITHYLTLDIAGIITNRPDVGIFLKSRQEREAAATAHTREKTFHLLKKFIPVSGKQKH